MKRNQLTDPLYYRNRLEEFIRERHPRLIHAYKLIGTRSNLAAQTYKEAIESGESPLAASARADTVLYEDLIFSRFDTLRCILATEFPMIPAHRQRSLALTLETYCEDVFARYNLDDGMVARSEYNHLIVELTKHTSNLFSTKQHLHATAGTPGKPTIKITTVTTEKTLLNNEKNVYRGADRTRSVFLQTKTNPQPEDRSPSPIPTEQP